MTDPMKALFSAARQAGGINFVYTLVRVDGMSLDTPDSLEQLRESLESQEKSHELYCTLAENEEPLKLLANLLRCAGGEAFDPFLLAGLSPDQRVERTIASARQLGHDEVANALSESYGALGDCQREEKRTAVPLEALGALRHLLGDLLVTYDEQRRAFLSYPRLRKMPGFEVLELLVDDDAGLSGFRFHFSNGERAEFRRTSTETLPLNISFDDGVVLFVGDTDSLTNEWRVDGKPLHEVGLPGRYNRPGEWKPLVYPADWDAHIRKAQAASERPEIQGALFYMFVTGHQAVEFAIRTTLQLPHEQVSFGGGRIELYQLPSSEPSNELIYDGTVYASAASAEAVETALHLIQSLLNRLAYAFDATIEWVPKYNTENRSRGRATPSDEDLAVLDQVLAAGEFSGQEVVDEAIDWYNRGQTSGNVFVAFLCAYIAFESVATAIWDGDLTIPVTGALPTKFERRKQVREYIAKLHDDLYENDPVKFVTTAYFEGVKGVGRKARRIAELVFGADSNYLALLFTDRDGYSLSKIRSELAHGRISLADSAAQSLVRERLAEIQDVARVFLLRVTLGLRPDEAVPAWSQLHQLAFSMADPRATLCTSSLNHLPVTDWRIRPEWVS